MEHRTGIRAAAYALAAVVALTGVMPAYAQTQGMERRDERRDDRAGARADKQECKAGDENSRAECRQQKRDSKQEGRNDGGARDAAPAPKPAE